MKRFKNLKKLKMVAVILIVAVLMSCVGCGKVELQGTTEESDEEDTLEDGDGFQPVRDYVVTQQDEVNVRVKPESDADVYITLDAGVNLNRTGVNGGWTRVQINGGVYYVESRFVSETTVKWATETDVDKVSHVVFIDPAKQITEDLTMEPINPDIELDSEIKATSTDAVAGTKAKMTAGGIGIYSGSFEYDITMAVANYLNAELVKRGYTVYLSRTTNNVNISNAKRAQMANSAGAEIYIKLETPESNDPAATGILGFIATSTNPHTGSLYQNNYELCYDVLRTTCEETGAVRMGIYETDNLTSLNYCDMPATAISMGFLSNSIDDTSLNDEEYRKKLAVGLANGIDLYFKNIEQ